MAGEQYLKPLPEPTPLTKPFWEAAKRQELHLQKCQSCGEFQWYPRHWCGNCGSRSLEWQKVEGTGTVYSFTVVRQVIANSPEFEKDIPFVVAEIDLDEGPRVYANVVGCGVEDVKIGMRVRVVFDEVTPEISLPKFAPLISA